ncbi:MAG TPA: helicase-related protein [Thermomicrobiales bacterium]
MNVLLESRAGQSTEVAATTPSNGPCFKPGDRVRLKADGSRRGAVVGGPRRGADGFEVEVQIDQLEAWYSETQLELIPVQNRPRWVSRDELVRELTLAKLRTPLTDALYSYRSSRTVYEPYQFRPALKFLRSVNQRILIADEVGLGKTIEAAIIYLELKARLEIPRVFVLCPSRLTTKWQDELRNRFEEEFEILDSARVRRMIDDFRRLGHALPVRAIASFEMLRRPGFAEEIVEVGLPLDLLIVDEAHHMRNEEARTYRLGAALVNSADAVVFLTATPLHLRNRDLFNLLNLLAPEDFDNPDLFEEHVRPNEIVNTVSRLVAKGDYRRAYGELRRVEATLLRDRFTGNPIYRQTLARLSDFAFSGREDSIEDRVSMQWDLMELNTLSVILSRTRKREVAHGAVRAPFSIRVTLSPAERDFYEAVLRQTREDLRRARPGATGFAAVMKERQAASCLAAMRERLEEAARRGGQIRHEVDLSTFDLHQPDPDDQSHLDQLLLARSRAIGEGDSKFDQFEATLRQALAESPESKALVFSFFKGTLRYLKRKLHDLGYGVEAIHGDVPIADRRRIIDRFASDPSVKVLLSSEVGAEGLDFQFCDILVNYDLPWNPMQVEQRIGRLDRFGQKHERIRIYNFFIEDTIETRIFQRLYERIRLFEQSIGDLEAILGAEIVKLSREALQGRLTPVEEAQLAEQAAVRIVRRQQEEAELERHKDQLLGQGQIFDQRIEQTIGSGRYVSGDEVRALVGTFVRLEFPRARLIFDEDEPCATLELDRSLADYLRSFIERKRLASRLTDRFRSALSEHRAMPLTFDSELARQRPTLEFVTVRHPLAEAARAYWCERTPLGTPAASVEISGPPEEAGDGHFYVYLVDVRGVTQSVTLESVVIRDDGLLAERSAAGLLRAIQESAPVPAAIERRDEEFVAAEAVAAGRIAAHRDAIEAEVRRRNQALLAARTASLRASFDAKIRRTETLLDEVVDERIRRMRRSQLQNLRARRDAKLAELSTAKDVSVSSALIAGGRVRIVGSG